jgi:small-conductance mechanosensitive channel
VLLFFLPSPSAGQTGPLLSEDATIWGYIYDVKTQTYLSNITIKVEREYFLGNTTTTDIHGMYQLALPSGSYVLRIYDEQQLVFFRMTFNITAKEIKRIDFSLDPDNTAQSQVYGTIHNKFTMSPMSDTRITLSHILLENGTYVTSPYRELTTGDNGKFNLSVPAGHYLFEVWSEDKRIYSNDLVLDFGQHKEYNLVLERPSRVLNGANVLLLLQMDWLNLVGIIIVIIIGFLLLLLIDRAFEAAKVSIKKRPRRFIDEPIIDFGERVFKWNIIVLMALLIAYLTAQIMDIVTTFWVPIQDSMASIYIIILLIILLRITLMIWRLVIVYLSGDHKHSKPKKILSSRMLMIIDLVGKYSLSFCFLLSIIMTALAALGMRDMLLSGFTNGLRSNATFIIFIVSLLIIAYVIAKFISSFFADMKTKTTKFSHEMIEVASKGTTYFVYILVGLIIIYTLLSVAGLGQVGQTIILVFSMIIGLVISMAATGSIGNMLSGLVILSFKPFDDGDWVIIAHKYQGEIIETSLMFTKLKNLENELIEIPNNIILSQGVVNWTTAARDGGFAIDIDATIGYDVPARQVIALMVRSSKDVKGVLKFPTPFVITTHFDDHAIGYKLRAYIDNPRQRFQLKTDIMVNMQKTFTEAGVEILSPRYWVGRMDKIPTEDEIKGRITKIKSFED